ncbi:leucine-rich repeat domain-contataining protein [Chloropicon primus]|nr:leucine-rich repeat domain-contataining protein [Chloropicon primus]
MPVDNQRRSSVLASPQGKVSKATLASARRRSMQLNRAPSGEQEEEERSSSHSSTRRVSSARRRASVKSARARSARSKDARPAEPPKPLSPEEQQRRNDVRIKLRNISERDQETLTRVCTVNGLDQEEDLINNPGKIDMISMMFYNTTRIASLQFFPCLKKLQIIQQNLTSLEGLRECTQLEELWVVESSVDRIEFLENCTKLKKLYLYSNRIRRVENLSHLHELEVLSLADNRIFLMENLEHLKELRNLNLANNVISVIGDSLAGLCKLETLNLAGNRIGSFKEVSNLSPYRLPKLKCLFFADPLWGHCPMTSLCNYQTYVLFILQQIESLDSIFISEEAKQLAEATYMKKKMYYNMRIKTLRRNTSNVIRIANEGKQKTVSSSNQALGALSYALTLVEREMYTIRNNGGSEESDEKNGGNALEELEKKRESLMSALDREYHQVATAEIIYDNAKDIAYGICNTYVRRMVIELETGGNIRLEDGNMSDLWYASCVDLVKSRSFIQDFKELGVRGVNIVRVTRIHNRCLRHKFEETVHKMSKKSDASSDSANNKNERSIEYLFYGEHDGGVEGEMSHVIEDGFRPSAEYASMGLDGAVKLSNSVSVSCYDEVKDVLQVRSPMGLSERPTCQLIISRVYLGKCTQYTKDKSMLAQAQSPTKQPAGNGIDANKISRHTMPGFDALFKVKSNNPKQRSWFVFDSTLVLPEYVVEFEFEVEPSKLAHPSFMYDYQAAESESCLNAVSSPEVRSIARPLQFFIEKKYSDTAKEGRKSSFEGDLGDEVHKCDKYQSIINMPPTITEQPKAYIMTVEILRRVAAPVGDLNKLTYLNLSANRIRRIENLKHLPNITTLILSFNQLTRIEGLEEIGKTLQTLDLGYNQIRKIEGVNGLVELRNLKLENNLIFRLEDVNVIRKYVPKLENLSLRNNAICDNKNYQSLVLKRLESLVHLDGVPVKSFMKQNLSHAASCSLTLQLVKENAYNHARLVWLRPDTTEIKPKSVDTSVSGLSETEFWSEVEELELDHKKIRKIENLSKLSNLKRLSLCDNEITRIEGLEECYNLEELCLEDNRVQTVENLESLRNLKKLDLGRNKISCISGFSQAFLSSSLTQLSLEDNEITSLQGISCLKNLLELYIGNNRIVELREVQLLKSFSKLIILDLLGNPLCDDYDYRGYTVYHLKKLKVLDGQMVESSEQAAARSKYLGRLTVDTLEEQVGHRFFDHLRDLDISNLRLRDVCHAFSGGAFANLCEVNLDNNLLQNVDGLRTLPKLHVLRLNNNRLDSAIFCEHNDHDCHHSKKKLCDICFPQLEVLQLGGNQIHSVKGLQLAGLRSLKTLFVQDNSISKIDGLVKLPNLQELILDGNRIKYLESTSLQHIRGLRELRLDDNGLRSLQHLCVSSNIVVLHAANNRISDIVDIDHLAVLKDTLTELNLSGNPVARKGVYRSYTVMRFPLLQMLDGRPVSSEERAQAEAQYTIGSLQAAGIFVPSEYADNGSLSLDNSGLEHANVGGRVPVRMTNMSFEGIVGSLQINTTNNSYEGGGNLGFAEPSSYHFDQPKPKEKDSKSDSRSRKSGAGKAAAATFGSSRDQLSSYQQKQYIHSNVNHSSFTLHDTYTNNYVSSVTFVPANHKRGTSLKQFYTSSS